MLVRKIFVQVQTFRRRPFAQRLPPCHISKDALSQLVGPAAGRGDDEEEDDNDDDGGRGVFGIWF